VEGVEDSILQKYILDYKPMARRDVGRLRKK
jgi:hypothetical protein